MIKNWYCKLFICCKLLNVFTYVFFSYFRKDQDRDFKVQNSLFQSKFTC